MKKKKFIILFIFIIILFTCGMILCHRFITRNHHHEENRIISSGELLSVKCKITEIIDDYSAYAEIVSSSTESGFEVGSIIELYGKMLNLVIENPTSFENFLNLNTGDVVKVYYDKSEEKNGKITLYIHGSPYLQKNDMK